MNSNDEILEEARKEAEQLLGLLEEGYKLFPARKVPLKLLAQGYTYYKNIVVPIKAVSHKYLRDDYEVPFLGAFIALFKRILEENNSFSNELAFRTLLEMGTEDSYILFDKNVSADEKKLYTTVALLADYSSIETSMKQLFVGWFNKLYEDNKAFLKDKLNVRQVGIIEKMSELINKDVFDGDAYTQTIKQMRQLVNDIKTSILNTHEQKKLLVRNNSFKRMKSGESHTLHGNVFLIYFRMKQQSLTNHLFRVYAYLTIAGNELLGRLSKFHKNKNFKEKVDKYMEGNSKFRGNFKLKWETAK